MKFYVTRTSLGRDEKPCEGAAPCKQEYFANGEMHELDAWEIEINTLEELIEFIYSQGRIVMNSGSIEIYDDYRE